MNNNFLLKTGILMTMLLSLVLAGCNQTTPAGAIIKQQEEDREAAEDAVTEVVENIPDWYLNPPDGENVIGYYVGQGESKTVQAAKDLAAEEALEDLAASMDKRISQLTNKFVDQVGLNDDIILTTEMTEVTKAVVAEAQVGGWAYDQAAAQAKGTNYIVYVLLSYPYGEANKILMQQIKVKQASEAKLRASKAFQELEEEIDKASQ